MGGKAKERLRIVVMRMWGGVCCLKRGVDVRGGRLLVHPSTRWKVDAGGSMHVRGDVAFFERCSIDIGEGAVLAIGADSYFNHDTSIVCADGVTMGRGCVVAWDVQILDCDFHSIDGRPASAPITIGNDVWIGCGATILKGAVIGDGCVVGAGAVCAGRYPAHSLVAGNPARVVRENVGWTR